MASANEFVAEQRLRIMSLCRKFKNPEKHFRYISTEIQLLDELLPISDLKTSLIKKLVTEALQHFTAIEEYKSDLRMLTLWKLLGSYSTEMKMDGVMMRLFDLGHFNATPQFYAIWAEHWADQRNFVRVSEIISKCVESCKPDGLLELFRPIVDNYFGAHCEISALGRLEQKSRSSDTLKDRMRTFQTQQLGRVLEVPEEKSSATASLMANENAPPVVLATSIGESFPPKPAAVPTHSFTRNMRKNAYDVFAQTLKLNQSVSPMALESFEVFNDESTHNEERSSARPSQAAKQLSYLGDQNDEMEHDTVVKPTAAEKELVRPAMPVPRKEFSVFCDEMTTIPGEPKELANTSKLACDDSVVDSTPAVLPTMQVLRALQPTRIPSPNVALQKDSPYAKRYRRAELSFNEDSLLLDIDSPKDAVAVIDSPKRASIVVAKNQTKITPRSEIFDDGAFEDEMTLAGAHGKFVSSRVTSTPRRSMAPGLSIFSPNEEELITSPPVNESLTAVTMPGSFGGSMLQRRLSMAPALVRDANAVPNSAQKSSLLNALKPKQFKTSQLVDALPRLTINTPVPEEEKEEDSAVKSPISAANDSENKENRGSASPAKPNSPLKQQGHVRRVIADENVAQEKANAPNICTSPWDEKEREAILQCTNIMSFTQCHDFREKTCPKIEIGQNFDLGGEYFSVSKLLGKGGFAKVFHAVNDEGRSYAIKYEQPACPWEVYICDALLRRLPANHQPFVMNIRDAYIFANSSVLVYDFYPCGTLLDLSNYYKKENTEMGGLLVTFLGIQLGRILEQVHAARIIHADVKPDNIVVAAPIGLDAILLKDLFRQPAIKLIDWGRSIDLQYTPDREFIGRAGTKCFDCIEMIYNRPWSYQTDFFGFVATIHVLIFNDYLTTTIENRKFRPVKQIKRRFALRSMWLSIFEQFLNVRDSKSLPSWPEINGLMESELAREIGDERQEWRKAVERFNTSIKNIANA